MSSFTLLVFSLFGGLSKSTAVAYKCLADLISVKQSEPYGQVKSIFSSSNPQSMQSEDTDLGKEDQSNLIHLPLPTMIAGHNFVFSLSQLLF